MTLVPVAQGSMSNDRQRRAGRSSTSEPMKKPAQAGFEIGGEGGIRTLGTRKGTPDFESGPFGLSGTSPRARFYYLCGPKSKVE